MLASWLSAYWSELWQGEVRERDLVFGVWQKCVRVVAHAHCTRGFLDIGRWFARPSRQETTWSFPCSGNRWDP